MRRQVLEVCLETYKQGFPPPGTIPTFSGSDEEQWGQWVCMIEPGNSVDCPSLANTDAQKAGSPPCGPWLTPTLRSVSKEAWGGEGSRSLSVEEGGVESCGQPLLTVLCMGSGSWWLSSPSYKKSKIYTGIFLQCGMGPPQWFGGKHSSLPCFCKLGALL